MNRYDQYNHPLALVGERERIFEKQETLKGLKVSVKAEILAFVGLHIDGIINKAFQDIEAGLEDINQYYLDVMDTIRTLNGKPEFAVIYGLYDPRTLELKYIGQTHQNLLARLYGHTAPSQQGHITQEKREWLAELRNAGIRPIIAPIEYVTMEMANDRERYWIEKYRETLVNGN